jgi:hypothetical protein
MEWYAMAMFALVLNNIAVNWSRFEAPLIVWKEFNGEADILS